MIKPHLENLLLTGKVIRPHGRKGLLRIRSYAQSEQSFLASGIFFLRPESEEHQEVSVLSVMPGKNFFLMKIKNVNSLEDAEKYRGAEIFMVKDGLVHDDEDEYFWYELIGLRVYLNTGRYLGKIRHILPTGSNDIYVVGEEETEFLIPAIHNVVEKIDLIDQKMIIAEMEGLLDFNAV